MVREPRRGGIRTDHNVAEYRRIPRAVARLTRRAVTALRHAVVTLTGKALADQRINGGAPVGSPQHLINNSRTGRKRHASGPYRPIQQPGVNFDASTPAMRNAPTP
jgi:hypothetical protein